MLPTVDFCGLNLTRLLIGANPFGGYSHQSEARDKVMREYHTIERIKETWARAEAAGINAMVTNNETPHVLQAVKEYLAADGSLKWIAQINFREKLSMKAVIDEAVEIGCSAAYLHGLVVEDAFMRKDAATIRAWCEHAQSHGIPIGVAGHAPATHLWVDSLHVVDFHVVCFFNCGSLHDGQGSTFRLRDMAPAVECIQQIQKPCIGYKIMGAGRIEPRMAFEYAFEHIKPTDVVNVGMHRGDNDNMVEENAVMVRDILSTEV
ncbi:hypothetical protein JW960_02625 [candidate division KSB1 bacterium]|nr:hypothetical protein [candidate division KSB1 bacterium]